MSVALNQPVPSPQPSAATNLANTDGIIYASALRGAAVYTSDELYNPVCKGVRIYTDITIHNGGSVTVKIQTRDPNSDAWADLTGATTAALAGQNQTRTLTVYPGITAAAGSATTNTEVANFLSLSWRVVVTVAAASVTFSVGAEYLL